MLSIPSEQLETLVTGLEQLRIVNYLHVVGLVILVYDILLTINLEVIYIWKAPWRIVKILYLLTRYLPFVDTVISLSIQLSSSMSPIECKTLRIAATLFVMIGIALAECLFSLRTWAVCGRQKWLGVVLSIMYIGTWGATIGLSISFPKSFKFDSQDSLPFPLPGCLSSGKTDLVVISWGLLCAYDAVIMCLIIVPAYQTYRLAKGHSKLIHVVIRDGAIYYVFAFAVALANIVVVSLNRDYSLLLVEFGRVLHAILACRVVLHAREEGWKTEMASSASKLSTLEFR